jgi:hypothetical protein
MKCCVDSLLVCIISYFSCPVDLNTSVRVTSFLVTSVCEITGQSNCISSLIFSPVTVTFGISQGCTCGSFHLLFSTWSLILREEHMLWVFENRALRRIFRSNREEVTGGWRRLRN